MFLKTIKGEKIILRSYKKEDIFLWQKCDIDEEVQRFMPEPKNLPMSDAEQIAYFEECKNDETGIYWSILWKEDSRLIGNIALTGINKHHGIADLGIVIGEKDYYGKGVATEAINLVILFALSKFKLRRISAEYEEGNVAMGKALLRNGFKRECVCKASRIKNKKPINTIRYFILLK